MFVQEIKAHAVNHYEEDGWDFVVETMTDEDILEIVEDCISFQEAVDAMLERITVLNEYRTDAQNS